MKLTPPVSTATLLTLGALALGSTVSAFEEGKLLIWINGDKGYRGIAQVGERFKADTGIEVIVEAPEGVTDKFFQAAQAGTGPDIFFWPHDRLGEWADAGLLTPLDIDPAYRAKFMEKAWQAYTHAGRVWAYPMALEAVGLIYNADLIETPPTQLSEIVAMAPALKAKGLEYPILWEYNNTYFTWGVLASGGAYVFGYKDGAYDIRDVGVNTPGAKGALAELVGMITADVMPKGVSYSVMEAKMNEERIAMMISGPWAWANLKKSGINYRVAPIPGVNGQPGRPFVGALGGMLNRASPNQDLAKEFLMNYLLTVEGLRTVDNDVPLGVPALKEFNELLAADPNIKATAQNVENGLLMPNVPQMGRFWSAMGSALQNATNGQIAPDAALDLAAQRIRPRN